MKKLLVLALVLVLAASTASSQTYSYDGAGRLTQVVYADGTTIVYTYDAAGNLTSEETLPEPPVSVASGDSGGSCFIATAAYGSHLHPHVAALRAFRDETLLTNPVGLALVDLYLRTSPPIAAVIAEHAWLRTLTRWGLTPIVWAVVYPVPTTLATALSVALVLHRRRRRALARAAA